MSATDMYVREVYGMSRERLLGRLLVERFGWAPRELNLRYEDDDWNGEGVA